MGYCVVRNITITVSQSTASHPQWKRNPGSSYLQPMSMMKQNPTSLRAGSVEDLSVVIGAQAANKVQVYLNVKNTEMQS